MSFSGNQTRLADRLAIADIFSERERFVGFGQRFIGIGNSDAATSECSESLAGVPLISILGGESDGPAQIILCLVEITAKHVQFAQRIQDHRHFSAALIHFGRERKCALKRFLGAVPLSD